MTQHVIQLRRHEVEDAQEKFGVTTTRNAGGRPGRTSIDPGDWVALNNRFNLTNMNKEITFRYAGGAAGVPPERRGRGRDPSGRGRRPAADHGHAERDRRTNNNTYTSQTVPLDFAG